MGGTLLRRFHSSEYTLMVGDGRAWQHLARMARVNGVAEPRQKNVQQGKYAEQE